MLWCVFVLIQAPRLKRKTDTEMTKKQGACEGFVQVDKTGHQMVSCFVLVSQSEAKSNLACPTLID